MCLPPKALAGSSLENLTSSRKRELKGLTKLKKVNKYGFPIEGSSCFPRGSSHVDQPHLCAKPSFHLYFLNIG